MSLIKDVGFIHLHVHTSFSLREGALSIARLGKMAAADAMPALAITEWAAARGPGPGGTVTVIGY